MTAQEDRARVMLADLGLDADDRPAPPSDRVALHPDAMYYLSAFYGVMRAVVLTRADEGCTATIGRAGDLPLP